MENLIKEAEEKRFGLSRDAIKYIAMLTMFCNHFAGVFLEQGTFLYELMEDIGYFTAITMCYFLVEGYRYTRSKKRYGIRLFVFAVISQVPFSLAFPLNGGFNMIYTLFLCFLILVVREKVKQKGLRITLSIVLLLLTGKGDWFFYAALLVIMFDSWWGDWMKLWKAYVIVVLTFSPLMLFSYIYLYPLPRALICTIGACIGIISSGFVMRFCYNGQRGKYALAFSKWFFYIFYPAHLLLLWLAKGLLL